MYTSSGILRYLIILPRMKHSGILQNLSPSYSGGKFTDLLHMTYTLLTHSRCAYNLPQMNVHPRVTADQMPIVGLSIFQLHQLQTTSQLSQFFQHKTKLTIGWFCAAFNSESGSFGTILHLHEAKKQKDSSNSP